MVLSRKSGERIMVGNNIELTVLAIHGRHVKLGIVGPADVPIHREEVYRRLQCGSATISAAPFVAPVTPQLVPPIVPLGNFGRLVDRVKECW